VTGWALPLDIADDAAAPLLRLVLPRDKRDRLARRMAEVAPRRRCPVWSCTAQGLVVVLIDSEAEAVLCPRHELVHLDGRHVEGQPMFATAAW
jgi:hypothetical protein